VALASALDKDKYDISVVTFYDGGRFECEMENLSGVNYVSLKKKGRWDVFPFMWRMVMTLRRIKPDILYSFLVSANCIAVLIPICCPVRRVVWGVRSSNKDISRYGWFSALFSRLEEMLSRIPDLIICNSKAGMRHVQSLGFPGKRMRVVPNGIDSEKFQPDRLSGKELRSAWGINAGETVVGLIGRFDPMKGHSIFLRAASLISAKCPAVRFVIVGSGSESYKAELLKLQSELNLQKQVIWAGSIATMNSAYNAMDLVVSSSIYGEGFPNVVGEAMACGVMCVVTDVGDSAWIVGNTEQVVPPSDHMALAEAIMRCMTRNELTGDERARTRILENFSVQALAARTDVLLSKLLV